MNLKQLAASTNISLTTYNYGEKRSIKWLKDLNLLISHLSISKGITLYQPFIWRKTTELRLFRINLLILHSAFMNGRDNKKKLMDYSSKRCDFSGWICYYEILESRCRMSELWAKYSYFCHRDLATTANISC